MTLEDHLIVEVFKAGLLDVEKQREDVTQFFGMVQRFNDLLPGKSGISQICRDLVRIIIEETEFDNCSILLWDPHRECLVLAAAFGLEDLLEEGDQSQYHKSLNFAAGEGIAGSVFKNRQAVFLDEVIDDIISCKPEAVVRPTSLISLPILHLGVLNLSSQFSQKFTSVQKTNWNLIGNIIGYILHESSLEEDLDKICQLNLYQSSQERSRQELENGKISVTGTLTEQVIDRTPQGICLLDGQGNVIRINKSLERLHGQSALEIIGHSPAVLFRDPSLFETLLEKAEDCSEQEIPDVAMINSLGELYFADVTVVRLQDEEVGIRGYLLVINDMTKKKATAEKILRNEKLAALGTMAGGVAHDFNNLLMSILGNVQLILPAVTDEEVRRRLHHVEKVVHEGASTVRRLQRFTKPDREPGLSANVMVDVNEVILEVLDLTRPRWKNAMEKHGHRIQFKLALEPRCFASMQPYDFREVLTSLFFNAIEAMPEGGNVLVTTKTMEHGVVVEVADSGIGMTEQIAARIFDPYFTTKGISNSGLGLSVAWSLLGRSGGEIRVKSRPGKGSVFTIKLQKHVVSEPSIESRDPVGRKRSFRVLLVDENTGLLKTLRDMLRMEGHWVMAVHDGVKALELFSKEKFDIVFADEGLRKLSGWEIAKNVKEKSPDIPFVLLTGSGHQYDKKELSQREVDMILQKPVQWEALLSVMEKLLGSNTTSNASR